MSIESICVFAGSSTGVRDEYTAAARELGQTLAARRIRVIFGGGRVGLMGVLADAALSAGGHVIGVIPEMLVAKEVGHRGLTELKVVKSMHERKAMMVDLAGGFIALPGGCGTLDEFFEVLTWAQLGLHRKPCGLLNIHGYFDRLLEFMDHCVEESFVKAAHRAMISVSTSPAALLDAMATYKAPVVEKWITPAQT